MEGKLDYRNDSMQEIVILRNSFFRVFMSLSATITRYLFRSLETDADLKDIFFRHRWNLGRA